MAAHSKEVVDEFCNACSWVHQSWQTRRHLFDDNPDLANLKAPHYEHFFARLSLILQEYWIQQLAKLHDPAAQYKHQNLSVDYILEHGQWDTATESELTDLRDRMVVFEKKLRSARNKIISHNDLSTILQATDLGGFNQGDDDEYFENLHNFASVVRRTVLDDIFLYDDLVGNDVAFFMAAFNKGRIVCSR
jgi:hypothetical protein